MKRSFTVIIAMLGIYLIFVANASGTLPGYTGAPKIGGGNEQTCGSSVGIGCHTTARGGNLTLESSKVSITLNGFDATKFKFDSTYEIAVTLPNNSAIPNNAYGFQAIVRNKFANNVGTFLSGTDVQVLPEGYATHSTLWLVNTMKFKWKAPSKDTSAMNVTLYVAANHAMRGTGIAISSENDSIYTKSLALTADTTKSPGVGIFNTSLAKFSVHPTLVSQFVTISSDMMNMNYEVFNTSGIQVIKGNIENNIIDVAKLNKGLYYIVVDQKIAKFMKD